MTLLAPPNNPHSMISSQYCGASAGLLIDPTLVHEEVSVDLHHSLHWTLCPDLMHNVLQHC